MSKIQCSFSFISSLLGLPDECEIVGLSHDVDMRTVILDVRKNPGAAETAEWPENIEPIFTSHKTNRKDLSPFVVRVTGHWKHEPDREWDTKRIFDIGLKY